MLDKLHQLQLEQLAHPQQHNATGAGGGGLGGHGGGHGGHGARGGHGTRLAEAVDNEGHMATISSAKEAAVEAAAALLEDAKETAEEAAAAAQLRGLARAGSANSGGNVSDGAEKAKLGRRAGRRADDGT
ncbi:hypothetical protein HYH03_015462 [Edaphochlamys debaryana]|uniref:Uncharacterized protein n=1 Tax=Edaphochlamys debaryana TaxID=47281 RepID=A0A835XLU6_9CHLO|nr:hypothetical protein HYH03_015462 [Edaphochlamys debaryana]|eukprot:KAG2485879.1 hypothetical protein HYH03_015462 [Edaphochlamys debaryana]